MSKRRRKGRRSNNEFGGPGEDSKKFGFLPMLIGMVFSFMLILFLISLFTTPSSPDQANKLTDTGNAVKSQNVQPSQISSIDAAELTTLEDEWNSLSIEDGDDNFERLKKYSARMETALDVLELKTLPNTIRLEWLHRLLVAHRTRYGVAYLEGWSEQSLSEEFAKLFQPLLDHPAEQIRHEAQKCQLSFALFEWISSDGATDIAVVVNSFSQMFATDLPADDKAKVAILAFGACVEADPELSLRLAGELETQLSKTDAQSAQFLRHMSDRCLLINSKLGELFEDRYSGGQETSDKIVETITGLLNEPQLGMLAFQEIVQVVSWFESDQRYDEAKRIFQAMSELSVEDKPEPGSNADSVASLNATSQSTVIDGGSADNNPADVRRLVTIAGRQGLERLAFVGKPVNFQFTTYRNQVMNNEDFRSQVIVIMSYRHGSRGMRSALNKYHELASDRLQFGRRVKFLATPTTKPDNDTKLAFVRNYPAITFVDWDGDKPPSFRKQLTTLRTTHLFLLDRNRTLVHPNVNLTNLEFEVSKVVNDRR